MSNPEFAFVIETTKSVPEAAVAVRKAVEAAKWGILGGYDFGEILASKGFPQKEQVRSLDICAPKHADVMLAKDKMTGLCMPCSVLIYADGGQTKVAAMRPGVVMSHLFASAGPELTSYACEIDEEIRAILTAAMA